MKEYSIGLKSTVATLICMVLLATFLIVLGRQKRSLFVLGFAAAIITSPAIGSSFEISCGPKFNQFPVSYVAHDYRSYPLIDARNMTKEESWSSSQADHDNGIDVDPGDVVEVCIYYHNGGLSEDCDEEEASAVQTIVQVNLAPYLGVRSSTHQLSGTVSAANAPYVQSSNPGKGGDLSIHIRGGKAQALSLVSKSMIQIGSLSERTKYAPYHLLDTVLADGVDLGTVHSGLNSSGWVVFQLKVSQ